MKLLIATLLATAAGASFAAPTFALNHDPATYRNATQKAAADYRDAIAKCDTMSGNGKDVCVAEAKLARTQTEAKALSKYSNSPASREKARTSLAEAEFTLAKARCDGKSGAEKDDCMNNAKSVHTAALADAKAGRSSPAGAGTPVVAAAAIDKCAQAAGDTKTACVIETKPSAVREEAAAAAAANRTANAADNAGDKARDATADAAAKTREAAATAAEKTKAVAATAVDKTKEVAQAAVDKTKAVASSVAQKTEGATAVAADKTKDATAEAADKTKDATSKTRAALADTAITTKVKAGLVKEPDLESLGIHVETEKGVVMLSGFVNAKSEADKAVKVAKGIDGVTNVKSAIQVK